MAENPVMESENEITADNSLHSGNTNNDDAMDPARGKDNNANRIKLEKKKQSTVDQHTQESATADQTIAMMQAQMERLKCLIMTQHNA